MFGYGFLKQMYLSLDSQVGGKPGKAYCGEETVFYRLEKLEYDNAKLKSTVRMLTEYLDLELVEPDCNPYLSKKKNRK